MEAKKAVLSTIEEMTGAFNRGDIDAVMRTYEPGAVVVAEPRAPVTGEEELRRMFAGFVAAQARFTFQGHEVIETDGLALHLTPWRMRAKGPDGSTIAARGLSVAVLRRQADGRWLLVIDHPWGDAILGRAADADVGSR
jgi:ketosteroid isomerase-like protein